MEADFSVTGLCWVLDLHRWIFEHQDHFADYSYGQTVQRRVSLFVSSPSTFCFLGVFRRARRPADIPQCCLLPRRDHSVSFFPLV